MDQRDTEVPGSRNRLIRSSSSRDIGNVGSTRRHSAESRTGRVAQIAFNVKRAPRGESDDRRPMANAADRDCEIPRGSCRSEGLPIGNFSVCVSILKKRKI